MLEPALALALFSNYLAGGGEVGSHVALRAGEDRHYVNTETTESNQISLPTAQYSTV